MTATEATLMPTVEWEVQVTEFANCNCNYGCPCQFNAPSNAWVTARAVAGYQIHQGHFANVRLDGLLRCLSVVVSQL